MWQLEIFREQLIVLAFLGGLALVALLASLYAAYYLRRPEECASEQKQTNFRGIVRTIPWIVLVTYLSSAAIALAATYYYHRHPPNW